MRLLEERRFGMPGQDFIIGNVTDVVDGETLNITVDRTIGKKRLGFGDKENIRIHRFWLTDIVWITGVFTRSQIEKMLKGKRILCLIRSRKEGGKIIADVQLI
jgi:hypothetical protein